MDIPQANKTEEGGALPGSLSIIQQAERSGEFKDGLSQETIGSGNCNEIRLYNDCH